MESRIVNCILSIRILTEVIFPLEAVIPSNKHYEVYGNLMAKEEQTNNNKTKKQNKKKPMDIYFASLLVFHSPQ